MPHPTSTTNITSDLETHPVRRAFSSFSNPFQPSRGDKRTGSLPGAHRSQPDLRESTLKRMDLDQDTSYSSLAYSTHSTHSTHSHQSDSLYSSSTTGPTDDDASSTTSRPRPRPRIPSTPSPLSTSTSILSSTTTASTTSTLIPHSPRVPAQWRVRHLEKSALHTGYLTKFAPRTFFGRKQWKRRYFILGPKCLHCFKSADPQHPLLETIGLSAETIVCVTDIFAGKRYCLQITSDDRTWYILADSAPEMSRWLRELKGTVIRFKSLLEPPSRPGTLYSDSSEMSDLSSSSAPVDLPSVPAIPTQYEHHDPYESHHHHHHHHHQDLYQTTLPSLNPPPRAGTPKPFAPSTIPEPRRHPTHHDSNTSSSPHPPVDYASFGTVMERAEAMSPSRDHDHGHHHDLDARLPRVPSTEPTVAIPRRSSQRLAPNSPSRPTSPVPARPSQSSRSSMVVSPPPRSIHRPVSIAVRHSTQMMLPPPPSNASDQDQGSLSRITSIRHTREYSAPQLGSLQERVQRSSSRSSTFASERPLSPAPSMASAPTMPLPEPPRSGSISPARGLAHSLSTSSTRRIPIVPRHHDPEILIPHRSKARSRSQSQESALIPHQRVSAINTAPSSTPSTSSSTPTSPRNSTPSPRLGATRTESNRATLLVSTPIQLGSLSLPIPPKGQQPDLPASARLQHKHSHSTSSLGSISTLVHVNGAAPAFGGGVARKHSSKDAILSARLSTLMALPHGISTASVPFPPQTALPPIPDQPLPTPPTSTGAPKEQLLREIQDGFAVDQHSPSSEDNPTDPLSPASPEQDLTMSAQGIDPIKEVKEVEEVEEAEKVKGAGEEETLGSEGTPFAEYVAESGAAEMDKEEKSDVKQAIIDSSDVPEQQELFASKEGEQDVSSDEHALEINRSASVVTPVSFEMVLEEEEETENDLEEDKSELKQEQSQAQDLKCSEQPTEIRVATKVIGQDSLSSVSPVANSNSKSTCEVQEVEEMEEVIDVRGAEDSERTREINETVSLKECKTIDEMDSTAEDLKDLEFQQVVPNTEISLVTDAHQDSAVEVSTESTHTACDQLSASDPSTVATETEIDVMVAQDGIDLIK